MSTAPRPSILLVDDDPAIRSSYGRRLTALGVTVEAAGDAFEGVQMAQQGNFDLILLDVRMPQRSGADVLRLLRAAPRTARTPVYLLADSGDSSLVDAAMRERAEGVFMKDARSAADVATDVATILGARPAVAEPVRAPATRDAAPAHSGAKSAVEQIAEALGRSAPPSPPASTAHGPSGAPVTLGLGGTPERRPAGRPVPEIDPSRGPRDAVDLYRRQERLKPRTIDEAREMAKQPPTRATPPPRASRVPRAAAAAARAQRAAPRPAPRAAAGAGQAFDTVLNRFVGQASDLARAVGVPPDLLCPACKSQLVLRLQPDETGRSQVHGHFVCPGCTKR